jgi:hypothetical protein
LVASSSSDFDLHLAEFVTAYCAIMKPEVTASDICIYLSRMIDVRLKRECMFVLFIILTARVNGQMIRLVLCC